MRLPDDQAERLEVLETLARLAGGHDGKTLTAFFRLQREDIVAKLEAADTDRAGALATGALRQNTETLNWLRDAGRRLEAERTKSVGPRRPGA